MANKEVIERLTAHIEKLPERFIQIPQDIRLRKPAPDKWSPQEILGHLIDSAINNLKRFTETQFLPQPSTVIPYQQDDLVLVNKYQQLRVEDLLLLWQGLNRQIVNVIKFMPAEKLDYTVITPSGEAKTLHWLIVDYTDHMEHHLRQIFGPESVLP